MSIARGLNKILKIPLAKNLRINDNLNIVFMIVINFKTYLQATGEKAVELASICDEVAEETGVKIVIGLQATDIFRVASQIKIPLFAQHIEAVEPGRNTGLITAAGVKKAGASGVFLNHSEQF